MSLDISENQITAFIGPSGCGKSTILKSINRMNDLIEGFRTDGHILLTDRTSTMTWTCTNWRKRVGMVFQQPNPFPKTVYDNVAYGPRTHGIKDKETLDALVEESLKRAAVWTS